MLLTRRVAMLSGTAVALAGCSDLIGPPPPRRIYVLRPDFTSLPQVPQATWALSVALPVAPQSIDTERIALVNAPNIMDYFADAQWTDRVPVLLQSLLVDGFKASGRIVAVGRAGQGMNSDYELETEVYDFEAYYATPDTPPNITVKLGATLVGSSNHEVAGTLRSAREAQAAGNDLPSITAAFSQAVAGAIEEIVTWSLRSVARPAGKVSEPAAMPPPEHHRHYR